jgi:hypothetical protein
MTTTNRVVLLLGYLLILAWYRKSVKSNDANNLYGPDESADFHSRFSYQKFTLKNSGYKKISFVCIAIYTLIVTNMALDYIPGWWALVFVGALVAYAYWISESATNLAYLAVESDRERRNKHRSELNELQKSCVKFLVATVVVSGLWFYQVQRNQSAEKLAATNEVADLVGLEWCANFADIDAFRDPDGGIETVGYGGWPCLKVSSVRNVGFEAKKDTLEMCFSYSLSQSDDGPWNRETFSQYDFRRICVADGEFLSSGWDEYSLETSIRENFGDELKALSTRMCSVYGRSMSYEQYSTYCS